MKMIEIVNSFRDRAISILRLQKINGFTEQLQYAKAKLKELQTELAETIQKLSDVENGAYQPSLSDVKLYHSAEEAKTVVVKSLTATKDNLERYIKNAEEDINTIEQKANDVEEGKHPFDRSTITELANQLIREHSQDFSEETSEVTDDAQA